MQFSAEIWRRSEYIQALDNFSKLIGEKSPIWRQRAKLLLFDSCLNSYQLGSQVTAVITLEVEFMNVFFSM
jgi:hypothetical protein